MITDQLKTETLAEHQQLEKLMVYRIRSINSVEKYIDLLRTFYGYYHPLEQKLAPFIDDQPLNDLTERRKSDRLLEDIKSLIKEDTHVMICTELPAITNTGEALGAMYVMEGSTLGGSVIADMVKKKISGLPDASLGFFQGYGHQTAEKWSTFKRVLNSWTNTRHQKEAVIRGANETFRQFHQWLKSTQTTDTDEQ